MVSNFTYDRYSVVMPDVRKVQDEWEKSFLDMVPAIDKTAAELDKQDPELMRRFITQFSVSSGEELFQRWQQLALDLFTKHKDYYVVDPVEGHSRNAYPEEWLRKVIEERGEIISLPD